MSSHAPNDGRVPESRFVGALDVPVDLPLATVGTRGLASAIDIFIVFVLDAFLLSAAMLGAGVLTEMPQVMVVLLVLGLFAVQYGYFTLSEWLMDGQTLGKRTLGIRVVEADGTRLGLVSSLIRNLIRFVDFLPSGYGIGVVAIFLTERCQRLGDLAAGTLVVREDPAPRGSDALVPLEGPAPREVALLEQYVALRHGLLPERREAVAQAIVAWLDRRYPEIAARIDRTRPAWEALEPLLAVSRGVSSGG